MQEALLSLNLLRTEMGMKRTNRLLLVMMIAGLASFSCATKGEAQERDFLKIFQREMEEERSATTQPQRQTQPRSGSGGGAMEQLFGSPGESSERRERTPRGWSGEAAQIGPGNQTPLERGRHPGLREVSAPSMRSLPSNSAYGGSCEDYLFLLSGSRERDTRIGTVVNSRTGEALGSVAHPGRTECMGEYFLMNSERRMPAIFHLPSESFLTLDFELPNGAPSSDAYLFGLVRDGEESPREVLVYTRDGQNNRFIGLWQPGRERVELRSSPFGHIRDARYVGETLQVSSAFPTGGTSSRTALHIVDDRGIEEIHSDSRGNLIAFLKGGWTAYRGDGGGAISPDGRKEALSVSGCRHPASLIAASHDASALLMACLDGQDEAYENYLYWSSERGATTWRHRRGYARGSTSLMHLLQDDYTVISDFNAPSYPVKDPQGVWVDLTTGTFFQGSPIFAMDIVGNQGRRSRFLGSNTGALEGTFRHDLDVYLIDIENRREEYLHTYRDCPGFLQMAAQDGDRFILYCITQPTPGLFRFTYHWSELIDLEAGTRWRESRRRHEGFTERGAVMISNLSSGSDLHYGSPSRLWIVD